MTDEFTSARLGVGRVPGRRVWLVMAAGLAAGFAVGPVLAEEAEEVEKIDPKAIEIATSAADFLAKQEALSVEWFVSYDVVLDGREKLSYFRSGRNELIRGTGFHSYLEEGNKTREYFYDFSRFTVLDVDANAYASTPFQGSFGSLTARVAAEYDIRLPIWTIMSADPRREMLESVEAAAYLGTTRIAGQPAHHLAMSDYDGDWQMWVSTDVERPVLLMLVGTNPYEQGWPQYRAYFANWDFDPDHVATTFTFVPDETAEQMYWPKVKPGTAQHQEGSQ